MVEKAVLAEDVVEPEPLPPPLEHAARSASPAPAAAKVRTTEECPFMWSDSLRRGAPQVRARLTAAAGRRRAGRSQHCPSAASARRSRVRQGADLLPRSAPEAPTLP